MQPPVAAFVRLQVDNADDKVQRLPGVVCMTFLDKPAGLAVTPRTRFLGCAVMRTRVRTCARTYNQRTRTRQNSWLQICKLIEEHGAPVCGPRFLVEPSDLRFQKPDLMVRRGIGSEAIDVCARARDASHYNIMW